MSTNNQQQFHGKVNAPQSVFGSGTNKSRKKVLKKTKKSTCPHINKRDSNVLDQIRICPNCVPQIDYEICLNCGKGVCPNCGYVSS